MAFFKETRPFRFLFLLILLSQTTLAQLIKPSLHDSLFSTYYHQRVSHFESLPKTQGDIIFLGNSITDGAEWNELFADARIKNRGISADNSAGVIHRIQEVADRKPSKIFLLIGTNDLSKNITPDSVLKNIFWIASYLRQQVPSTQLFVQSILPVNNAFKKFNSHTGKGELIKQVNAKLKQYSSTYHYTYIDVHTAFCDENGKLKADFTNDGLHLKGEGYVLWKHMIFPYVFDLQAKPSLIPLPQQLQWTENCFPLFQCKIIIVKDESLQIEGLRLQQQLAKKGLRVEISGTDESRFPSIELKLGKVSALQFSEEAYKLSVNTQKVVLTANTTHGIFNGLQTLEQLMRDGAMIDGCEIIDWPSFSWRGYMVDVGRNYQSLELLKQQIEVMSRYKLNVFHFHPTEDIAWRIAVKQYPQLTAPENMLRNKGLYYSEDELKELIAFCKERYITFVPEIDMPGHSAAFKRAMKTDMQSDSGLLIVKNILREFCSTYDVPYLHIGADEVKINNKQFIPEVTAFVQSFGKKVIGWEPGGNFSDNTIRQLWMDDNGKLSSNSTIQYIDSRHLYLNHMDPLESVVTIFNRRIGNREKGGKSVLGGTICLWHDRSVAKEDDLLKMNPVYPSIVTFAERSWRGGGNNGWVANIGSPESLQAKEFSKFEDRLLDSKQQYFVNLPFPYVKQSGQVWKLFGPYKNSGDLQKAFDPESKEFDMSKSQPVSQERGGTVVLRHWWAPLIKGAIDNPEENTTWYAATSIWSEEEKDQSVWIGFNNLSRSPATDSPKPQSWNNNYAAVWVNGKLVDPPHWKRGGQKGNAEIPLIDEGYEYREPTKILLRKGWNTVLVKVPIGRFKGKDWQNPEKWMFTFVIVP